MELWQRFTTRARRAVVLAHNEAISMGMPLISTEHLLMGLLALGEGTAVEVLKGMGVALDRLAHDLRQHMVQGGAAEEPNRELAFTPEAQRVLQVAYAEAKRLKHDHVGTEHVLIGLVNEGRGAANRLLRRHGVDLARVRQGVAGHPQASPKRGGSQGKSKTPHLDLYSRDLTALAREGELDPTIGREAELTRLIQILCRRTKNNPCLIGDPGVGKTAIAEGLAQRIADGQVPALLADKRVVALDLAGLVAGTKYRGEFEERMKRVMDEIRASRGQIIVFLDELHTLVGTGAAEGAMDASNILKPALARGELRCIGATTLDEYRKYVEKNASLERRFQPIMVEEPKPEQTMDILHGIRERYEEFHGVVFTEGALSAAVDLSTRYITDRRLPDKAIDLIDEAGSRVKLRFSGLMPVVALDGVADAAPAPSISLSLPEPEPDDAAFDDANLDEPGTESAEWEEPPPSEERTVHREDIAEVVSTWTGIPVTALTEEESARLLRMEDALHARVVAQDEAIIAVAKAVRRARAGIKDPMRPTGSFIFLGPTGVGKTLLAKALAEFLFGDEDALVRVDMSEYMEKFAVSRLVGAPPGYVGYEESGQLTEAVRRRPYSVVLFDEIEKAHPEVFSILLQVMEDGRLTDAQGRVVDFRNTVIIMTSNVGARLIAEGRKLGFATQQAEAAADSELTYKRMKQKVTEELKKTFSPEFLNRVDDVVVFHALNSDQIRAIVDIELRRVRDQLAHRGIKLVYGDDVRDLLAKEGYEPALGARPLRRAVRRLVEDPLAEEVLMEDAQDTLTVFEMVAEGEALSFRRVDEPVPLTNGAS